jgi:type II secretory pathway pseudopilin PulG
MVELLVVVLVIAVLSGTAISLLSGSQSQMAAEEAIKKVAADISYVRSDAMANARARYMVFGVAGESYRAYDESDVLLVHPQKKSGYTVSLATLYSGAGLDMTYADFGGSDTLFFGANGVPAAGGRVSIDAADIKWTVTVAGTGHLTISN